MKQFFVCFFIGLSLCISNISYSQNKAFPIDFSLSIGASAPSGNFGDNDIWENPNALGAFMGYTALIDIALMLNDNIFWGASGSISVNETKLNTGKYDDNFTTTLIMTGLGLETTTTKYVKLYALGQVGIMLFSVPDIPDNYTIPISLRKFDLGKAFAYSIGGGTKYKLIHVSVRYNQARPSYEMKRFNRPKVKIEETISFLQLMIGVNF